jgi:TolA-binding protein
MSFFGKKLESDESNDVVGVSGKHPTAHPGRYGIEEAIRLMRGLPLGQNPDLVIGVVKTTLESMNVHLGGIIQEGAKKQQSLHQQVRGLKGEIAELEKEIAKRRQEIDALEQDLSETTTVKERLELAETLGKSGTVPPAGVPGQVPSHPHRPPPPLTPSNRPRAVPPNATQTEMKSHDEASNGEVNVVVALPEDERQTIHQLK